MGKFRRRHVLRRRASKPAARTVSVACRVEKTCPAVARTCGDWNREAGPLLPFSSHCLYAKFYFSVKTGQSFASLFFMMVGTNTVHSTSFTK